MGNASGSTITFGRKDFGYSQTISTIDISGDYSGAIYSSYDTNSIANGFADFRSINTPLVLGLNVPVYINCLFNFSGGANITLSGRTTVTRIG
jgi:hypothetical protein